MASLYEPIPNSTFYSQRSNAVSSPQGFLVAGSGITVDQFGTLLVASALGGTVTSVTAGTGLTGGTITTTGTISLVPATNVSLGGIKVGANLLIAPDGTLSALSPGTGTINNITVGTGLSGGGTSPSVSINLVPASATQFGGVIIGSGINVVGGLISLATATTLAAGGALLASSAEVIAGTNASKIVTPATLAAKVASTLVQGIVRLSDTVATNSTLAATPTAVKVAYDAAVSAQTTASAALPKAGGTMTGDIVFSATQTFPGVSFPVATSTTPGVIIPSTGLTVNSSGYVTTINNGTVTSIFAGAGLGAPATGNAITTSGTIKLLAPTVDGLQLGGVKQGTDIVIGADGTISATGLLKTNNPYSYNSYIWPVPSALNQAPGTNNQVLTLIDNVSGTVGWTNAGTLTSVVGTTGVTAVVSGGVATISLTPVPSITAGSYGATALIPTFAVNSQGQITSTGQANPYSPFQTATVTVPTALVLDFDQNNLFWEYTLTGNLTIDNPIGAQSGQTGSMLLRQDAISPYAITWGSSWKFAGATPPAITSVAAAVDMFTFTVYSANYIVVTSYLQGIG
jgi:hypothetical protein